MAINDGYVHSSTQFSSLDVELITTINFHCSVPFSLCSTWKLAWDGLFLCGGYYTRTWKYDTLLIMLCILRAGKSVLPQYAGAWLLLTQYFVKTAKCSLMNSSERLKSDWKEEHKLKWANKKWIFNSQILTPPRSDSSVLCCDLKMGSVRSATFWKVQWRWAGGCFRHTVPLGRAYWKPLLTSSSPARPRFCSTRTCQSGSVQQSLPRAWSCLGPVHFTF